MTAPAPHKVSGTEQASVDMGGTMSYEETAESLAARAARLERERDEHAWWRAKLALQLHEAEVELAELRKQLGARRRDP